jgi:hypothetical protein
MKHVNNIYLFIHSFIRLYPYFCFLMLPVNQIINRRMVQSLVNTELEKMCKEKANAT